MNKNKVNGVLSRLHRIQRELHNAAAEFGDVDNYFMTELEDASSRIGRVRAEIEEWKSDWSGSL